MRLHKKTSFSLLKLTSDLAGLMYDFGGQRGGEREHENIFRNFRGQEEGREIIFLRFFFL